MELDHNSHSVFLLYYHLVMVIKYRRKVLNDEISERAKEQKRSLSISHPDTGSYWKNGITIQTMFM